ncbi:CocE/NonD family hydrolase [Microbacterium sp. LWH7-1.2]|uniref:CocE/NonD family hydrolase n=1 Tax=Microbacterium sp. LWH7-1.2 TaxID=3135257 RepID=UPI00313A2DB3
MTGTQLQFKIMRLGVDPTQVVGKPAPPPVDSRTIELRGMVVDYDTAVPMRDGARIYVDVYRPRETAGGAPMLLAWGPYGKHWLTNHMYPGSGVDPAWISDLTAFEAPDPIYWTSHGYAVVVADPRGLWNSEGDFSHNGPQEREDLYDTIEWLAAQPWSSGNVGMLGVSYLAGSQYQAASAAPPSLKAISPWECFSDWYREFATHGGIPETGFRPRVSTNVSYSRGRTEDPAANMWAHPFDDWYYAEKYGAIDQITIPTYMVASWSDHGLHTRGTLNAFDQISSADKWLEVHGQKKWMYFYHPDSVERQRQFFDTYLKGMEVGLEHWPRVSAEIRDTGRSDDSIWKNFEDAKFAQEVLPLHLDLSTKALHRSGVETPHSDSFDATSDSISLEYTFDRETDIVGPASLTLWLAADHSTDADIFVILRKIDRAGAEVAFPTGSIFSDGPVALGWLRASHRETDDQSTLLVPHHPHTNEEPLVPGEPVKLDIEIWASGTVFHAGETLRLTIQGRDFQKRVTESGVPPLQILHESLRNSGTWTILSGGSFESVLRLPRSQ